MTRITFCTIAARNYVARARVLGHSLERLYPDNRYVMLIVDAQPADSIDPANAPWEVIPLESIGLDVQELHRRAAIYDVTEFSTSIKPWLMERLLDDGDELVVYVDPDIELFAQIDDLIFPALEHDVVLTPSTTAPVPYDEFSPHESDFMRTGQFNLGYLAISQRGRGLLQWWMPRLRRDCLRAEDDGYFVDQRWLDLAQFYFDAHVVRDPGCNVAWWNLAQHEIVRENGRIVVGGFPLRFFHFSSFNPFKPRTICTLPLVRPMRYQLKDFPPIAELCLAYAGRLFAAGHAELSLSEYGFDQTTNGLPIDARARRMYRKTLVMAEAEGIEAQLPDPFEPSGAARFLEWLRGPWSPTSPVSRYLKELWDERTDLQVVYPDLAGEAARGYLEWVAGGGQSYPPVPRELSGEAMLQLA